MSRSFLSAAALGLAIALGSAGGAAATERVDHYERKASETIEQAVANFKEYNAKLAAALDKPALTEQDLEVVHELTYTLENALEKISETLGALAETLEELHVASETHDPAGTKAKGADYLATARAVIP